VINVKFEPPQTANEHGAKVSELGFQGKWEEGKDVIECREYADDRVFRLIDKGASTWLKRAITHKTGSIDMTILMASGLC